MNKGKLVKVGFEVDKNGKRFRIKKKNGNKIELMKKNYSARLFDLYKNNIQSSLKEKLNIKNVMELPKNRKNCFKYGYWRC